MPPRSKADSEEATIVSIEMVAKNLEKQVEQLQNFILVLQQQKTYKKRGVGYGR